MGNKTCYRPNAIPEMVNNCSSTSLLISRNMVNFVDRKNMQSYPDREILLNKRSKIMSKCSRHWKFLLSNYDTRDWKRDLINFVNCWKNWFHQKKFLEALKRKRFWKILLLELSNLLFEQLTVYRFNNLLFEWFTVKYLNTLIFK